MTALTAAFMAIGAVEHRQFRDLWGHHGHTQLSLIEALVEHAVYADALYVAGVRLIGPATGHWHYEVASRYGRWFVNHLLAGEACKLPGVDVCRAELEVMVYEFFVDGQPKAMLERLHETLKEVK